MSLRLSEKTEWISYNTMLLSVSAVIARLLRIINKHSQWNKTIFVNK